MGLIIALFLPPVLLIIYFKIKFSTNASMFDAYFYEAIWINIKRGFLAKNMISCLFPSMALFFVFFKIEWWQAGKALVVGTVPYFILLFFMF